MLAARHGHFLLESGHHGELWLDLELLCLDPRSLRQLSEELAAELTHARPDFICAPLIEGAFVGLWLAEALGCGFLYTERGPRAADVELFPYPYAVLRPRVRGRRVVIVNDVINAGSAVAGTLADLHTSGAEVVGLATLLTLGDGAVELTAGAKLELATLARLPNTIQSPERCPQCAKGLALDATPFRDDSV